MHILEKNYILSFKSSGSGKFLFFIYKLFSKDALNVWKSDSIDIYKNAEDFHKQIQSQFKEMKHT